MAGNPFRRVDKEDFYGRETVNQPVLPTHIARTSRRRLIATAPAPARLVAHAELPQDKRRYRGRRGSAERTVHSGIATSNAVARVDLHVSASGPV